MQYQRADGNGKVKIPDEMFALDELGVKRLSDYDPHYYRIVDHPTNNFETFVHLLKGCLGTGILAMHQAFSNSGWLNGLISIVIIGFICTYSFIVLINAQYKLCKKHQIPLLSYAESMKLALEEGPKCLRRFSSASVLIVDIFLVTYQLGTAIVYIVFMAENFKQIADMYIIELHVVVHMVILLLPLILINFIKNLKILAPFSTFANILAFVGIGLLCYFVFQDIPDISQREMVAPIAKYPLYFGTTLFALEAVGVVVALENNMEKPKSFPKVLISGMTIIVILYATVGFLGYLKYGADSKGSITLNLPAGNYVAETTKLVFSISIFLSYGLQAYVAIQIIWDKYVTDRFKLSKHRLIYEYLLRIAVTLLTFAFAAGIPRLGLFISLFGAFCLSMLGVTFPALMDICVHWPYNLGKFKYILCKDILLIIIGFIGLISGTYTSIREIIFSFM